MIAISCSNIVKRYGIEIILNKISFSINEGEKIGLIGDNGSGKSTLFKIITSQLEFDEGDVFISKNKKIGYLEQKSNYDEELSVYDACLPNFKSIINDEKELRLLEDQISNNTTNQTLLNDYSDKLELFDKNGGYLYKSKIRGVLSGIGFSEADYDTPVNILSGGQKSKLQLALLLLDEPDILLLDEPTNHLDLDATAWLENFLMSYSKTVITITHDRYFLDQISTRIIEIDNKVLYQHKGNYSDFLLYKANIFETQLNTFNKQQKEIDKQEEIIRRFKGRGTEKLAKRARSREKMLDKIEVFEKPTELTHAMNMKFEPNIQSGEEVLKVKNLSKSFEKLIFENINFDIFRGEKIGLVGPNGVGKTTLFKILLDELNYETGEVTLGHNVFPGYFDQEQKLLNSNNNMFDEILEILPNETNTNIRAKLGMFLFQGDDAFKRINSLSGGEKGRLSLLKLMLTDTNFILLDEPTNHLDIKSKEILEQALNNYNGTLLIISHDRYFLNNVTNKTFEFQKTGMKTYLGNYDYYLNKKSSIKNIPISDNMPQKTKTELKKERELEKKQKQELNKLKKQSTDLMDQIEILELELEKNELLLCKEEIYSNGEKSKELNIQNKTIEIEINTLYEQWGEIDEILQNF